MEILKSDIREGSKIDEEVVNPSWAPLQISDKSSLNLITTSLEANSRWRPTWVH